MKTLVDVLLVAAAVGLGTLVAKAIWFGVLLDRVIP